MAVSPEQREKLSVRCQKMQTCTKVSEQIVCFRWRFCDSWYVLLLVLFSFVWFCTPDPLYRRLHPAITPSWIMLTAALKSHKTSFRTCLADSSKESSCDTFSAQCLLNRGRWEPSSWNHFNYMNEISISEKANFNMLPTMLYVHLFSAFASVVSFYENNTHLDMECLHDLFFVFCGMLQLLLPPTKSN